MANKPLIQIVDKNDNPVGTSSIHDAQQQGLIQQISRIMLEDDVGSVVLQRRASQKRLFPDRWDNSAAGHVDAGEDYLQAAHREMLEEVGLSNIELTEVGYFYTSFTFKDLKLNQFQKVYRAVIPYDTKFQLERDEVSDVKWFERRELLDLLDELDSITVGLAETIKRFYT